MKILTSLLTIAALAVPGSVRAEDIYIIGGDLSRVDQLGRQYVVTNPLLKRSMWDRLKSIFVFDPGESEFRSARGVFMTTKPDGGFDYYGFKNIETVFNGLKAKGYKIHVRSKIEVKDLLKIISDPETVGVFHVGHSFVARDPTTGAVLTDHIYLSAYENGNAVPLTSELIQEELANSHSTFHPGRKLRLFFTGSCKAGYCESRLRHDLSLPSSVEFISASGSENSSNPKIAKIFSDKIANWAEQLPAVKTSNVSFPACVLRYLKLTTSR